MSNKKAVLPHISDRLHLTDGGLETTLVFVNGIELPAFSSVVLMVREDGGSILDDYFKPYIATALRHRVPMVLESVTWRASSDWAEEIGLSAEGLVRANCDAIDYLKSLRERFATEDTPMVVSGCVGPRGDGYEPGKLMLPAEAEAYHSAQIGVLKEAGADVITGMTINNTPEAIGMVRAAQRADVPCVISFTVETDGRLPTGQTLQEAVEGVDAATDTGAAYYMINCAHPTHFNDELAANCGMPADSDKAAATSSADEAAQ